MASDTNTPSFRPSFNPPLLLVVVGVLLIGGSLLPVGQLAAESQWTSEDSAKLDRLGNQYKESAYQPAARLGLSETELDAQRAEMRKQIDALQQRLDRVKSQPARWSRYMLIGGVLFTAVGAFAQVSQRHT